jgi:small subunit ribosomal protein S6
MEKKINYETLFVVDATLGEDAIRATIDKFVTLINENAVVDHVNEWGKRKLAYAINYKTEGYYVLVTFASEPAFPAELDRIYNITEGILRSIVIKQGE